MTVVDSLESRLVLTIQPMSSVSALLHASVAEISDSAQSGVGATDERGHSISEDQEADALERLFSEQSGMGINSLVSSNSGPDILTGLNINTLVGADRFYQAGFTGSDAVVGNIEAGHIWNGHESLAHVTTYVHDTQSPGPQTGEFDRHATWVGMILGGRETSDGNSWQQGIAPGASLISGAIGTQWVGGPYTLAFNYNESTFITPYRTMMISGVGPAQQTADVINSSWSGNDTTGSANGLYSRGVDALVSQSGKAVVFSAGNTGDSSNTVGGPAAGYNVITVASLGQDTDSVPYQTVSSFSSRGLNDLFIPLVSRPANVSDPAQGSLIPGVRAVIDISAPGQNLTSALYGGLTGGNLGGTDSTSGSSTQYSSNIQGTSFASPVVAGGLTLMADAARSTFGGGTMALDGRVSKSILQTSASKNPGWSNHQLMSGDVITTTQSLDAASGAGILNLENAFDVLLTGTADVAGQGGGNIGTRGWDFGRVTQNQASDYYIQNVLPAGSEFSATLNWFVDRSIDVAGETSEVSFDDLNLEIWLASGGSAVRKVAESVSLYNTTEHLHFSVPETAEYMIRVSWAGEHWDFASDANWEDFGLSWSATGLIDGGIPAAISAASDILLASADDQIITVRFADDTAIVWSDIGTGDIRIHGPNGFSETAVLHSVTPSVNSSLIAATYLVSAPSGVWNSDVEGVYTIELLADQVHDQAGNAVPAGILGSFKVEIADPLGPDGFGYVAVPVTHGFEDISQTGLPILHGVDDDAALISDAALGDFQFSFYGTTYSSLFVSTNGLITFGTPGTLAGNSDLTASPVQAAIAVLWDDLSTYGLDARIFWQVMGSGPTQRLIIQWNQIQYLDAAGEITFQAVLSSFDGSIQINYRDLDGGDAQQDQGRSATVGIRNSGPQGNQRLLAGFNQGNTLYTGSGRSIRFQQPASLNVSLSLNTVRENAGTVTGIVTRHNSDPAVPLIVRLASNHVSATVPPSVIIPAGQLSASFSVTLQDDTDVDGSLEIIVSAVATGMDEAADVLQVLDDESAGLQMIESEGHTTVSEDQTSDTVSLKLSARPLSPVVVRLSVPDSSEAIVTPTTMTFTPDNWNVLQVAVLTGIDDTLYDGHQSTLLRATVDANVSDERFRQMPPVQVMVTNLDNEAQAPTVSGPAEDNRTAFPLIVWSSVPGAVSYEVWLSRISPDPGRIVLQTVVGTSLMSPVPLGLGRYGVWVRAVMPGDQRTQWSVPGAFYVNTAPVLAPMVRQQATYRPTLSWAALSGAATYEIWIDNRTTGQSAIVRQGGLRGTSYQVAAPLPLGSYRVWLRGADGTGRPGAWSVAREFDVSVAPQIIGPESSTFDSTPTFRWNEVNGASSYRLVLQESVSHVVRIDQIVFITSMTPSVELPAGQYVWWVQARGSMGLSGLWSDMSRVTIGGRPQLTSPSGRQTSRPVFRWDTVGGAAEYSVAILRLDAAGTSLQADHIMTNEYRVSGALSAGQYRAWVRAISQNGQLSVWSAGLDFVVVASTEAEVLFTEPLADNMRDLNRRLRFAEEERISQHPLGPSVALVYEVPPEFPPGEAADVPV